MNTTRMNVAVASAARCFLKTDGCTAVIKVFQPHAFFVVLDLFSTKPQIRTGGKK